MISHLFKNGIIVTVNPDREIFFHGAVAVKDDRIVDCLLYTSRCV